MSLPVERLFWWWLRQDICLALQWQQLPLKRWFRMRTSLYSFCFDAMFCLILHWNYLLCYFIIKLIRLLQCTLKKSSEFSGILHISHRFVQQPSSEKITKYHFVVVFETLFLQYFLILISWYNIIWKITRAQRKTSLKLISCNSKVKPKSKISCNLKFWIFQDILLKWRQSGAYTKTIFAGFLV